jgi:hypothetical protein
MTSRSDASDSPARPSAGRLHPRSLLAPVDHDHPDRAAILEAERTAIADAERPGSWFGEDGADGRMLTQEATDMLIRDELWRNAPMASAAEREELIGILGAPQVVLLPSQLSSRSAHPDLTDRFHVATVQRGGIDSDPLVRLLAYRAWGHRDRRWFEDRGVRMGERVSDPGFWADPESQPVIALARPGELVLGRVLHDARPGEQAEIEPSANDRAGERGRYDSRRFRVSERTRVDRAAGAPARDAPSSFEALMCQIFGFDRLRREYSHDKRWTVLIAERSGLRTATRVSDARLARAPDALRHHACRTLAVELTRLGASGIRLGDPFDSLARRLGIPPITPAIVHQVDPAVAATLFIDFHDMIEAGLARGTPAAEVAHELAVAAPMPHDDAVQLVAMAAISQSREHEEILMCGRPTEWTNAEIAIDGLP